MERKNFQMNKNSYWARFLYEHFTQLAYDRIVCPLFIPKSAREYDKIKTRIDKYEVGDFASFAVTLLLLVFGGSLIVSVVISLVAVYVFDGVFGLFQAVPAINIMGVILVVFTFIVARANLHFLRATDFDKADFRKYREELYENWKKETFRDA